MSIDRKPSENSDQETPRDEKTSEKKIAANILNSSKSPGPTSARGKARTRFNALKHGLYSDQPLPGVDPQKYAALVQDLIHHYKPQDALQLMYVHCIAKSLQAINFSYGAENHLLSELVYAEAKKAEALVGKDAAAELEVFDEDLFTALRKYITADVESKSFERARDRRFRELEGHIRALRTLQGMRRKGAGSDEKDLREDVQTGLSEGKRNDRSEGDL